MVKNYNKSSSDPFNYENIDLKYGEYDDNENEKLESLAVKDAVKHMMGRVALGRLDDGREHPVTVRKREEASAKPEKPAETPAPETVEPQMPTMPMSQAKSVIEQKRQEYGRKYYQTADGSIVPADRYNPRDLNGGGIDTVER